MGKYLGFRLEYFKLWGDVLTGVRLTYGLWVFTILESLGLNFTCYKFGVYNYIGGFCTIWDHYVNLCQPSDLKISKMVLDLV